MAREASDDRSEFLDSQSAMALLLAANRDVRRLDNELTSLSDHLDYSYMWRWLGVPIIQMPSDIVLMQEIIWENKPQVIVETGLARGGSALLYSSILGLIGDGKVVAVDIDIRPHNRKTVEEHPMGERVTLIEGSSTTADTVAKVRSEVSGSERVMVVLDSDHSHAHVLEELRLYSPMVTAGQFLVVADTLVEEIEPHPSRVRPWGPGNNPRTALDAFLAEDGGFEVDAFANDRLLLSSSRGGYLRRR